MNDDNTPLTPSQLNTMARSLLEDTFTSIAVEGEIGNLARPSSGHLYFTLKDERAQIRCALFKPKSQWLRFQPREGMHVVARGKVTLYEARGDYQMVLDSLEEAGEGALQRAYEALKAKLQAEGVFDSELKRAIPVFPQRIGILTSPTGAAIRDVLSVLQRRMPLLEVDILPVPVQGDTAAAQILKMLNAAIRSARYDVILITRGGGSLEDLWAFNDEALTRAVANSPVPIVSAIGHEVDFTLVDFAADVRAPTPSVAAELLSPIDHNDLKMQLRRVQQLMLRFITHQFTGLAQRVDRSALRLQHLRPQARLAALAQRMQDAKRRMHHVLQYQLMQDRQRLQHQYSALMQLHPQRTLQLARMHVQQQQQQLHARFAAQLHHKKLQLHGLARSLEAMSPLATVTRGYSIIKNEQGELIRSVKQTALAQTLHAQLADGSLVIRVQEIKSKPEP